MLQREQRVQKSTEEYRRESRGGGGVLTGDQFDPKSIVTDFVPTAPHTNHKNLFGIARRVRAIEMKCERLAEMGELMDVFDAWYYKSTPFLKPDQSKEEYLGEFLGSYERVNHPEMDDILETAIERLNGRLKGHRKLNSVRGRGIAKVKLHAMMAAVVCQA